MRRRSRLVLLIVAVVVVLTAAGGAYLYVRSRTQLLARAQLAARAGNFDKALSAVDAHIAKQPADFRGYLIKGRILCQAGRYDEAGPPLEKACELAPRDDEVWLALSNVSSLPARRVLGQRDADAGKLREAIAGFRAAQEVLERPRQDLAAQAGRPDTPKEQQDQIARTLRLLREEHGLNAGRIATAYRQMRAVLTREAGRAQAAGDAEAAETLRAQSAAAAEAAGKAADEAIETLVDVLKEDTGRSSATAVSAIVDLCLAHRRTEVLRARRDLIARHKDAAPQAWAKVLIEELVAVRDAGDAARTAAKLKAVEEELASLVKAHPEQTELKLTLARLSLERGQPDRAVTLCDEILAKDARNAMARMTKGQALLAKGDRREAERVLFALATDFRQWPKAQYEYAMVLARSGKEDLAVDPMRAVTRLPAESDEAKRILTAARKFLTRHLLEQKFYEQALADARPCYEANPGDREALTLYVAALSKAGQTELAADVLAKALTAHPGDPEMLMAVAEGYTIIGRNEAARQATTQAAAAEPDTVEALLSVASAMVRSGRAAEAEKLLQEEMARHPERPDPRVVFAQARLYAATGRVLQAMEAYRRAVELDDGNPAYRLGLARMLVETGDLEACEQVLAGVPAANPAAALLRLRVRLQRGEPVDADQLPPELTGTQAGGLLAAVTYLTYGRPEKCVELCDERLKQAPDDQDARGLLAEAYRVLGEDAKAVEAWTTVLKAAPERTSTYLRLAAVLGRTQRPEQVAMRLNAIPGANADVVEMVTGLLFEQQQDYRRAAVIYGRLAERSEAPAYLRGRARLRRTGCLWRIGEKDPALRELTTLAQTPGWRQQALFTKVSLALSVGRADVAVATLEALRQEGSRQRDVPLLHRVARACLQIRQLDRAASISDEILRRVGEDRPNDAAACLLKAAVLEAAGKLGEAIGWYRRAIEDRPGEFSIRLVLANRLDATGDLSGAMAVLDELAGLGKTAQTTALFAQGRLLARWGLAAEALRRFEQLLDSGYADHPGLMLSMGRALAALGNKARAREELQRVPRYAAQYVAARQLLAALAETQDEGLAILAALRKAKPDHIAIPIQEMRTYLRMGRADEAVRLYREYAAGHADAGPTPPRLAGVAVQSLVEAGQVPAATDLCVEMIGQTGSGPAWRHLAVLLGGASKPDRATGLLPAPSKADVIDALNAIGLFAVSGDQASAGRWSQRLTELIGARAADAPRLAGTYAILVDVACGRSAASRLRDFQGNGWLVREAAAELVGTSSPDAARRKEAGTLLRSALAYQLNLPSLGRAWAMSSLKARPTCQWAAALALGRQADAEVLGEVLEVLQPKDCIVAELIQATQLAQQGKVGEAAAGFAKAASAEPDNVELLMWQASAVERAGGLEEATRLYRKIWELSGNPVAANNAAYLLTRLGPDDAARLDEARALADEAVKAAPAATWLRDTLGWILYLQGRPEEACVELRQAIKALPDRPEVHCHLGLAEAAAGRPMLARWHLAAAASHAPRLTEEGQPVDPQTREAVEMAVKALAGLTEATP